MSKTCDHSNRSYLDPFLIPFRGDVVAYRKGKNDVIEKRFLYIYKITCLVDNRVYVGKRIVSLKFEHPLLDNYKGSGYVLKILKERYDWYKDFKLEIVKFCKNEDDLNESEKYYVDLARSEYKDLCCNIYDGGCGISPARAKELWENEEYRQFQSQRKSELNKEMWKDPFYRKLWTSKSKERMSTPEARERSRQTMSANWENEEWREKQRERSKKQWEDEEFREKMIEVSKKRSKDYWESHPERKEEFAEESRQRWKDPEFRERKTKEAKERAFEFWSDPENRKNNGLKSKQAWIDNPQRYEDQAERAQALNEQRWSGEGVEERKRIQSERLKNIRKAQLEASESPDFLNKKIKTLKSFISPFNNKEFEEGTMFESVVEFCDLVGITRISAYRLMTKLRDPGLLVKTKNGVKLTITKFEFVE